MKKKPSELFEGPNSSLRKTFDDAVKDTKSEDSMPQGSEEILGVIDTPYTEWGNTELYIDLAPEVSHRITAREGVFTNRLQMKAGEIVGLKELLSSHTTYWKERVEEIYSHFSWCQECAEGPTCKDALAIKDNLK